MSHQHAYYSPMKSCCAVTQEFGPPTTWSNGQWTDDPDKTLMEKIPSDLRVEVEKQLLVGWNAYSERVY